MDRSPPAKADPYFWICVRQQSQQFGRHTGEKMKHQLDRVIRRINPVVFEANKLGSTVS
jgi:hypothetical protein